MIKINSTLKFFRTQMILFSLGFFVLSCDKPQVEQAKDLVLTAEEQELVSRSNDFAFRLYGESMNGLTADQNALLSPLSIQAALAMTYHGADGDTKHAIADAIGLEGVEESVVQGYFQKMIRDLPQLDPSTKMNIANSIWYRDGFSVLPEFLKVNTDYYQAEVKALDFDQPDAVDPINYWVDQKTQGKITKIIENIKPEDLMLLVNAVYFKGGWEQKFDPEDTTKEPFHAMDGPVEVDFMKITHKYKVRSHAKFHAIELPYGNKKYSMVAVLPQPENSISDLIELFQTPSTVDELLGNEQTGLVETQLYLPKFKYSYSNKLNDEMTALGMGLSMTEHADFSRLSTEESIQISEIQHKSFIETNEEGTEAAAVTAVVVGVTSAGPPSEPFTLKLDRPFLFLIREIGSGLILFVGQINNPLSETTEM